MSHVHIPKTQVSGLAIGFSKPLPLNGIDIMTDDQVRTAILEGKINVPSSIEALRRSGRGDLALELEVLYGAPGPVIEDAAPEAEVEDEASSAGGSAEVEQESSASDDASDDAEAPVSEPSVNEVSASEDLTVEVEKLAVKSAGGWYEVDPEVDGKSKVRLADVPDDYTVIED